MAIRILIVDDEEDIRDLLKFHLKGKKYDIDEMPDVLTAKQYLSKHIPDLVLADVMMPDVSGIDLCQWAKSQPSLKNLPIIVISALSDDATVQIAMKTGAAGYITKPIDFEVLDHQIELTLKRSKRQKEIDGE